MIDILGMTLHLVDIFVLIYTITLGWYGIRVTRLLVINWGNISISLFGMCLYSAWIGSNTYLMLRYFDILNIL